MTDKTTAALKLAEEAIAEHVCHHGYKGSSIDALAAISEALAEQDKQEPVYAFRRRGLDDFCTCTKERYEELVDKPNLFEVTTFYAAPVSAKREWVELTDDEIDLIEQQVYCRTTQKGRPLGVYAVELVRAVIAAFKEKNK